MSQEVHLSDCGFRMSSRGWIVQIEEGREVKNPGTPPGQRDGTTSDIKMETTV